MLVFVLKRRSNIQCNKVKSHTTVSRRTDGSLIGHNTRKIFTKWYLIIEPYTDDNIHMTKVNEL